MVPTTAWALLTITTAALGHPVGEKMPKRENMSTDTKSMRAMTESMSVERESLSAETESLSTETESLSAGHTGSIFGGLELDQEDYADYDYQESLLPEDPLPAGPTRRPDQHSPLPLRNQVLDNSALTKLENLPFLTTRPPDLVHGTTRMPRTHFGLVASNNGKVGSLLVHSSMDVVDQTRLFSEMDPFQEQFITPPKVNAGALPLSVQFGQNLFPPFNQEESDGEKF